MKYGRMVLKHYRHMEVNIILKMIILTTAHLVLCSMKSKWGFIIIMLPCVISLCVAGIGPSFISLFSSMCIIVSAIAFCKWNKKKWFEWGLPSLSFTIIVCIALSMWKFPPERGMIRFNVLGAAAFIMGLAQLGFRRVIGWMTMILSDLFFICSLVMDDELGVISTGNLSVCLILPIVLYVVLIATCIVGIKRYLPSYYKGQLNKNKSI